MAELLWLINFPLLKESPYLRVLLLKGYFFDCSIFFRKFWKLKNILKNWFKADIWFLYTKRILYITYTFFEKFYRTAKKFFFLKLNLHFLSDLLWNCRCNIIERTHFQIQEDLTHYKHSFVFIFCTTFKVKSFISQIYSKLELKKIIYCTSHAVFF